MKSALMILGALVAATLLMSCGGDDGGSQVRDDHSDSSESISATPEDGLDGLGLNDGRKWNMDDHTRSVFAKMAASFLGSDYRSLEEEGLKRAGSALQVDLRELIQGCTMTGDAHDQLHVYLTGYMPAVASLSDSGRAEDARKVARYLEKYDEYFE